MRKRLLAAAVLCGWLSTAGASPAWMGTYYDVGGVYSYGDADVLAVFLDGVQCVNQKNYFLISPVYVNNASQLIAMVLTAKASGKKIRFFEDSAIDSVGCYVKGVWISD